MRAILLGIAFSTLIVAPALSCGPGDKPNIKANVPKLAATLDDLSDEHVDAADLAKVKELRTEIKRLAARGKMKAARDVEEKAMLILGYTKAYMRCGPGTFMWMKLPAPKQS